MKIQYASDLHLEFEANSRYLHKNPIVPTGDILLLAGDIGVLGEDNMKYPFWDWAAEHFQQTLVVPGNHEFYQSEDLASFCTGTIREIRSNIKLCYNSVETINNVDFLLTTLWAHIRTEDAFYIRRALSDFHYIKYGGKRLEPEQFNREHQKTLQFLDNALKSSVSSKRVVVSHHVPTELCMSPEFKGSTFNGAFVVELHDFIYDNHIDYWIYGHSHRNMPEVDINGTKVICNQLGYIEDNEQKSFNPSICFDI